MNIQSKAIVSLILLAVLSGQAFAKNKQSSEGKPPPRPEFSEIDINEDGDVDIDEFSSLQLPFGDHQTVFDNIDADNNGIITEEEFKNHKPPRPPRK